MRFAPFIYEKLRMRPILLAFSQVILVKHLGVASRPFNLRAFRIEIMRLNLAYADQQHEHSVFVERIKMRIICARGICTTNDKRIH